MAREFGAPTRAELEALARDLKPGQRISLGHSIQFTVDRSGRHRFQYKAWVGKRQIAATFDSYEEALAERQRFLAERRPGVRARRAVGSRMLLAQYVGAVWWPDVLRTTAPPTQLWYRSAWENDLAPYWGGATLGQLCERDSFTDWDAWLHTRKVHRHGVRKGETAEAAIDKAYNILFRILQHARDEGYIEINPLERAKKKRRRARKRAAKQASDELRPISAAEVPTVLEVELLRFYLRGRTLREVAIKRCLIDLLAYEGLRPGEALYLRHRHHRTAVAPRRQLIVEGAVKDLGATLAAGATKTGRARTAAVFDVVRENLDRLYEADGGDLDALVLPNSYGSYLRWDNFRTNNFYPALHRAGIATAPTALATGSFVPYRLRHLSVTLQFHADKPEGGRYDHPEIAHHHGDTVGVLLERYTHVYRQDLHEANGRTIDEIVRAARREVWGPLPGDPDFVDHRLALSEAAAATGLGAKALAGRVARRTLPIMDGTVRRFDLLSLGLLPPALIARRSPSADSRCTAIERLPPPS